MTEPDTRPRPRVLVVDDEPDLVDLLSLNLEKHGFIPLRASNGRQGLSVARAERPDLAIIDVMMPEMDGIELLQRLKRDPILSSMPVLMLTAKTAERDELGALSIGAEDYVAKPFSMGILIARVQSLLRRSHDRTADTPDELSLAGITVNLERHEASVAGTPIHLTLTEFRILAALLAANGRVLSRKEIIAKAIGMGVAVTKRTIDVHVTSLRRKLLDHAHLVETVRGVGYRAGESPSQESGDELESTP